MVTREAGEDISGAVEVTMGAGEVNRELERLPGWAEEDKRRGL